MTKESQRVAIAEACGYKHVFPAKDDPEFFWALRYLGEPSPTPDEKWAVPDYLADLNAMHEAEKVLTPELILTYQSKIYHVTMRSSDRKWGYASWHYIHATAEQRAEAFLRTLNLWTP